MSRIRNIHLYAVLTISLILPSLHASIFGKHKELKDRLGLEYVSLPKEYRYTGKTNVPPSTPRNRDPFLSSSPPSPNPSGTTMNLNLIELGADPTGVNDSTTILQYAIDTAAEYHNLYNLFIEIELQGGNYLISAPLTLSGRTKDYSSFIIRNGQITVNPLLFPNDGFIFYCVYCNQITWMDLILDNNHVGGGIYTDTALQNVVDNVFFLHYKTMGIYGGSVYGMGHELLVSSSVFAEYMWGEPNFNITANQNGTAIFMTYPDNNFYNVIIRCTRVGIVNRAGANLYHGVHIYSTCNKDPDGSNVAIGYLSDASQNRITNCYFDDSPLVLADIWSGTITNNLFFGLSGLIFAPQLHSTWINSVLIKNNVFTSTSYSTPFGPRITYDTTNGTIDTYQLSDVVITDNMFSLPKLEQSTRVTSTVLVNGSIYSTNNLMVNFTVNVSNSLLFMNTTNTISNPNEGKGVRLGNNPNWKWYEAAANVIEFMNKEKMPPFGYRRQRSSNTDGIETMDQIRTNYRVNPAAGYGGALAQLHGTVAFAAAYDSKGNSVLPFFLNIVPILNLSPAYDGNGNIQNGMINGMIYIFNNNENTNNMNATYQFLVTLTIDQSLPTATVPG